MAMTEARLSYTTKVMNQDLLTARGDTEEEFAASYAAAMRLKQRIEGGEAATAEPTHQEAVATVQASMGGQVIEQQPASAPKPPPAPMPAAAPAPAEATSQGALEKDKWGNDYYYDLPNAPLTPDGRKAVMKDWVSQSGKRLKRWIDPLDGPRKHAHNGPKWEGDWAN